MATSRHSLHSFIAPAAFVPATMETRPRAAHLRRAVVAGLTTAREAIGPVRVRINAPLLAPPRFGTVKEYRAWKARRRARPLIGSALQWPLGVWVVIGVTLVMWLRSALS
jgi:hypothetical protein